MTLLSPDWHSRGVTRRRGIPLLLVFAAVAVLGGSSEAPRALAAPCVTNADCDDGNPCTDPQVCHATQCVPAFTVPVFPIGVAGVTAYNAPLISVMDHQGAFYTKCCDTVIVAFTGETAVRGAEVELCPLPPGFPACLSGSCICGYKHPRGGTYVVNGHYEGALFNPQFLSYDGHAGYDYRYAFGTPLVATRDGTLCKAQEDFINGHVGTPSAWDKFHTFYIDHGVWAGRGYASWYLHAQDLQGEGTNGQNLQDLQPGECAPVAQGQGVATVGNFGSFAPHLHFELRRYAPSEGPEGASSKGFDPYGWSGNGPDPLADPHENPQAETQAEPVWVGCGNGRVDCGEQCDDANVGGGDCCSSSCQFEPLHASCSDSNVCTNGDQCNGAGTCGGSCVLGASCLCGGTCQNPGSGCVCVP